MTINLHSTVLSCDFDETGITHCKMLSSPNLPILSGGVKLGWMPYCTTYPKITSSSIQKVGPVSVKVIHDYDVVDKNNVTLYGLQAIYEYTLSGRNIRIHTTIKNLGVTPTPIWHFGDVAVSTDVMIYMPSFVFSRPPSGSMHSWDWSYPMSNMQNAMHPGTWTPFAASWMYDEHIGICMHSPSHFYKSTVFNTGSNTPNVPRQANVAFWSNESIPAGKSITVDLCIHVSVHTDLKTMLESYVSDYHKIVGGLSYVPDDRPIGQYEGDSGNPTPLNPLGYNGNRLDTKDGVAAYISVMSSILGAGQGQIFWQPQGYNTFKYRPDFSVWPQSVQDSLPVLISWFNQNKLRFGLCARPGQSMTDDGLGYVNTDPNNATQMKILLDQFRKMSTAGVTSYYCDSLGSTLIDYQIMKAVRKVIGPKITTYTEYTSDILLKDHGVYTEIQSSDSPRSQWYSPDDFVIFRMLQPKCSILGKSRVARNVANDAWSDLSVDWFGKNKITPLIFTSDWSILASGCKQLTDIYLVGNTWK